MIFGGPWYGISKGPYWYMTPTKNVSVAKVLKKILILGQSFNKNSNLGHVREIYPNLKPIC
jgi:hypothetical protein